MKKLAEKGLERFGALFFVLLRTVAAVTGASFGSSLLGVFVLFAILEVPALLGGAAAFGLYNGLVVLTFLGARRVGLAVKKAIERRDLPEAMRLRQLVDGRGEPRSKAMRSLKGVGDGELLLDFEKWGEAADTLASVDLDRLPELSRPGILSELGYARAHAGDTKQGLADIERAFELADAQKQYPDWKRFHLVRRRGVALALAGKHARAVEILAALRDDFQGNPRDWAEAFFYLGRSHASLGEKDAAAAAFAAAVAGDGPFASRAWKELDKVCDAAEVAELRETMRRQREAN